jgi:two-component system NtrC family sensor kinase
MVSKRRPGLWKEIAGALGLLTLAVLVLNAGVFWVVLEQSEVQRQTDLAMTLGDALEAQLGAAVRSGVDEDALREAVRSLGNTSLDFETLVFVDASMHPLEAIAGEVPKTPDAGFRSALFAKETHLSLDGSILGDRRVVVTVPVAGAGKAVGALRLAIPLRGPQVPGGALGFALVYAVACGGVIALFGWARLSRTLVAPIQRLKTGTSTIASGDFGYALDAENTAELQDLVEALNAMSTALAEYRIQTEQQVRTLKKTNDDLHQAQEALVRSERLAGVGRIAAGLAHEVGNPLAAVFATVDLLGSGTVEDTGVQIEMLHRARTELDRIHVIMQSLLDYARIGTGLAEPVDVVTLLNDAIGTVSHQPKFKACAIHVETDGTLLMVQMEREKLHQVVVNLLHNAADASSGTDIVLLAARVSETEIEFRCEDGGVGFAPVALERAFEPFFTTKDVGEGTGLGLSTCMVVIEGAGGTIEVTNLPEAGACVRIRLPSYPS